MTSTAQCIREEPVKYYVLLPTSLLIQQVASISASPMPINLVSLLCLFVFEEKK